ncbi:MAG: hypothetical protein ACK479_01055 [Fluviicola sp.]
MLKNILFILLFLTSFQVFSQGKVGYYVKVINKVTGKKEPGATVKVYEGSTLTQTVTVPNSAQTVIDLNEGKKYKIEISKDGKVSRFFYVDLTTYSDEGHQGDPLQGETEIGLFDKQPGVDYSYIENNEITTFKYDGSATLALDQAKAQKMGQKIDEIINKAANDQKNTDANYSKLVSEADGMYTLKKYEDALKKYEAASLLKPAEQHPIQRINEISAILKSQKEANAANAQKDVEYNSLIKSADAFRDQKKYDEAISKYTEALSKKADEYPKTQIENCKSLKENAAKAEEIEKNYQAAMSTAQVFVGQKSWSAAKDKYKEALKLKPNDPVATQKLADVMVKLDDQKKEQDKKKIFQQLSDEGDALFTQEKWVEAKAKYTEALKIEPASTYLADKMKDVNAKLAEIEAANAKKAQIDKLLAEGKTAIDAKQFPTAKTKYEEVLKLDDKNAEAKEKLTLVEQKLAEEKANAEKIANAKKLVLEGDALAKTNKNAEAKVKYEEAQKLYDDPAVKAKIDALDAKLKSEAEKAAAIENFKAKIKEGDDLFAADKLEEAKAKYTEAQTIDANSAIPKAKIIEVDKKIAANNALADKSKKYQDAYNAGVQALGSNDLTTAKAKLTEATTIDNTKQEAKDKLAEVNKLIADGAAAEANKKKFETAMKAGDDLATAKKYTDALAKYKEAQALDASQTTPAQKITEMENFIAADNKNKQLNATLTAADLAFTKKDYTTAKSKYNEVLGMDNSNAQAQSKLAEIAKIETELAGAAEKQARITKLIEEGNTALTSNNLAGAKGKFTEVLGIDATNATAIQKLKDIKVKEDAELALVEKNKKYQEAFNAGVQAFAANDYPTAKAKLTEAITIDNTKQEAKDKLTEVNSKMGAAANAEAQKKKYDAAIKAGEDLMASNKFVEARAKFVEAQTIDATQAVPSQKIAEIDAKIAESTKTKQIETLLNEGQASFGKKDYATAKAKYQAVLSLDASNTTAQTKLTEINNAEMAGKSAAEKEQKIKVLLAEGDAALKSNDLGTAKSKFNEVIANDANNATAKAKLTEIANLETANASSNAKKQQIDALVSQGNTAISSKDYSTAKGKFNQVLALDDANQLAKTKLAEIAQLEKEELENRAGDAKFNAAVTNGDQLMMQEKYLDAMKAYEEALAIKNDPAVSAKRNEAKTKAEESTNDADRQFQKILQAGQKGIDEKDYVRAKSMYKRALELRTNDPEATKKLVEIEELIKKEAKEKELLAAYTKKMTEGDALAKTSKYKEAIVVYEAAKSIKSDETLPDVRIAEMNEKLKGPAIDPAAEAEKKYQEAMNAGNAAVSSKSYTDALAKYNSALVIKPGDVAAQQKINEVNNLIKANQDQAAKLAEIAKLQVKADALFVSKKYSEAKPIYEQILAIDASHAHSLKRVAECLAQLQKEDSDEVVYKNLLSKADKKFDETNYSKAREIYEKALAFRPNDEYPKRRIKEIEDLLKPKTVTQPTVVATSTNNQQLGTVTLKNPGIPTTEEDDLTRLAKDAEARKNRKFFRAKSIQERTEDETGNLANKQNETSQSNDSTFFETKIVTEKFNENANELAVNNDNTLKNINDTIGMATKDMTDVESFEIKTNQEQYAVIQKEQSDIIGVMDGSPFENAEVMKVKKDEENASVIELTTNAYSSNKNVDSLITDKKIEVEKVDLDNYDERKLEEEKVKVANEANILTNTQYEDKEKKNIEFHEATMVDIRQNIDEINRKEESNAPANKEIILEKEEGYNITTSTVSDDRAKMIDKNAENFRNTYEEQEVRNSNENQYTDENNTELVIKTEVVNQADRENYTVLYAKTLENKELITQNETSQLKYADLPSIASKENNSTIDDFKIVTGVVDQSNSAKAADNVTENVALNDNVQKKAIDITTDQTAKVTENSTKIKDQTSDFAINTERNGVVESDKNFKNQATLDSLSTQKPIDAPKAKNDLGNTYPEGVSEDKFDRYDAEGLLTAVVTRRIVVVEGHGSEYQKIQSLSGITYMKNGEPTSEYVWQKETTGPKLVKH